MANVLDKIAELERRIETLERSGGTSLVSINGAVIEGDIEFPLSGFIMNCATKRYRVTINCSGVISASEIV